MTAQKKILDLTGSQYLVQKVKSAINDVDSSLSTHIADTDIHVTTADKNKWNNQSFVFRYSSTALTPSSTNANSLLDNTDNLKVGDKVIDSSGVLFSVTAIDTQNSTFTIGTALIDLAQDSDVVHKSGDETITGNKTFSSINGVEPSSLSLPDLSNGIDISSYITDLAGSPNIYSPPANGYIVLRSTTANVLGIVENTTGMGSYSRGSNQVLAVNLPVVKNSSVSIYAVCSSLTQAKFIPCQGNV